MNLPPMNMRFFFFTGSFVFGVQAIISITLFFINLSGQNIFSFIYTWLGICFNFLISYFFLTTGLATPKQKKEGPVDDWEDKDIKKFLKELKQ